LGLGIFKSCKMNRKLPKSQLITESGGATASSDFRSAGTQKRAAAQRRDHVLSFFHGHPRIRQASTRAGSDYDADQRRYGGSSGRGVSPIGVP
jgi:transposase